MQYYEKVADADEAAVLARLPSVVSDPLVFYGRVTSLPDYLKQERVYFSRWPVRHYELRPSSLSVGCDPSSEICTADAILDFSVANVAANRKSSGNEAIHLRVRRTLGGFVILEQGRRS